MNYRHFGDKRFQYPRRTFYYDRRIQLLPDESSPYYSYEPRRHHFSEEVPMLNDIDYSYYYFNERRVPYFNRRYRYRDRENHFRRLYPTQIFQPQGTNNYYRDSLDPYWNEEFYDNNFYYGWENLPFKLKLIRKWVGNVLNWPTPDKIKLISIWYLYLTERLISVGINMLKWTLLSIFQCRLL